jgi:hypothetical protein
MGCVSLTSLDEERQARAIAYLATKAERSFARSICQASTLCAETQFE